jgi:hypothetical protein
VAGLLEPGGFVYLVEGHPFAHLLDDESGMVVTRDYFDSEPQVEDCPFSYTDGPALEHARSVEFQHGIGELITALADAGLRIDFLHEYDFEVFRRFESLQQQSHGIYRFPPGRPRIPLLFSLRASLVGTDGR